MRVRKAIATIWLGLCILAILSGLAFLCYQMPEMVAVEAAVIAFFVVTIWALIEITL